MRKRWFVDTSGYAARYGLSWIAQDWGLTKRLRRQGLMRLVAEERQTFHDKWGGFRLCREVNQ